MNLFEFERKFCIFDVCLFEVIINIESPYAPQLITVIENSNPSDLTRSEGERAHQLKITVLHANINAICVRVV